MKQAPQALPVSSLDRVENVADRRYLLCHSDAPPRGEDDRCEPIAPPPYQGSPGRAGSGGAPGQGVVVGRCGGNRCGGARKSREPGSMMRPARASNPDGYLLGSYRIATAPEPNSSRLTSFKSTCFDSPANNVGPWPASLGCTTNSYSSINPSSANASGSFTPPTSSPLPAFPLSC